MTGDSRKAEIFCPVCGKVTFAVRRPVFDGLKKTGEKLSCSVCQTEFEDETQIEFIERGKVTVFTEDDGVRLCLNCKHYITDPFIQKCMLHRKEVEATDTCEGFVRRPPPKKEKEKETKPSDALKKLFGEAQDKTAPQKP